jgi:hypothetical protein
MTRGCSKSRQVVVKSDPNGLPFMKDLREIEVRSNKAGVAVVPGPDSYSCVSITR